MKIDFQFDSKYGVFCDALYFDDDAVPAADVIEQMKLDRFNAWISAVENPPVDPDAPQEPPREEA